VCFNRTLCINEETLSMEQNALTPVHSDQQGIIVQCFGLLSFSTQLMCNTLHAYKHDTQHTHKTQWLCICMTQTSTKYVYNPHDFCSIFEQ